jgi:hypothetical protein
MEKSLLSQFWVPGQTEPITDPNGINLNLGDIINFGVNFLFLIAILAALGYLILGGITWITSGGNKEGLEKARKTIIYALVGLAVVVFSAVLVIFVGGFFWKNNESPKNQAYDCPDGSNRYYCGDTSDTQCPRCSSSPSCTGAESLLECTNTTSFCTEDVDCPAKQGGCPIGQKAVAYCVKTQNETQGHCATNCVKIDNFDQL